MAVKPSNISVDQLNIENYSYVLPPARIAQEPLAKRDASKLLVYNRGQISDSNFTYISEFIPSNSLLVANNSRVIHARLFFQNETGATIEIFFLEPIEPASVELAMAAKEKSTWFAYVGNARRWKTDELSGVFEGIKVDVKKDGVDQDMQRVVVSWACNSLSSNSSDFTLGELLEKIGHVPLPPYMKRNDVVADKERYQTVYAKPQGSVAAPTAGLHFTPQVFASLVKKGVSLEHITLHVGAGTFKSVGVPNVIDHIMHHEHIVVSRSFIEVLRNAVVSRRNIVCVGTTSVRTLESLYWIGVKLLQGETSLELKQWEAYELPQDLPIVTALDALLNYLKSNLLDYLRTSTQLLIAPGYKFRFVNMLITNFHVPKSTLLLLVAAFIGDDWKKVYSYALENGYRFLSYGDSSILIPKKSEN